ncbi:hypothetical protein [Plasticicumulans acidivorans]|uniref:Competence protein CoiA-like protein n=1 Tax=Plasticicumulans acidivorans TaxID=886464 RepID=A0A317MVD7_9GAMM|nr:hypothetical protein [Plasticicumulans acidivorans]PWV62226.1 hypothetical protein C7443_10420 [Plasticicumulans acidivorans]
MPWTPTGRRIRDAWGIGMGANGRREPRLSWGLGEDGRLHFIEDVERGLACACRCTQCSARLVARNGGRERAHHFAHYQVGVCIGAAESALHRLAKQIIAEAMRLRLPELRLSELQQTKMMAVAEQVLWPSRMFAAHSVDVECSYAGCVPDLLLRDASGEWLVVEIAVTHFATEEKTARLKSADVMSLQIDLSRLDRQISRKDLTEILIDGVEYKSWLHHPHEASMREAINVPLPQCVQTPCAPMICDPEHSLCGPDSAEENDFIHRDLLAGFTATADWLTPQPAGLGRRLLMLYRIACQAGEHSSWPSPLVLHAEIRARLEAEARCGDRDAQRYLQLEQERSTAHPAHRDAP